jgi:hypothetical protein
MEYYNIFYKDNQIGFAVPQNLIAYCALEYLLDVLKMQHGEIKLKLTNSEYFGTSLFSGAYVKKGVG